MIKTGIDISYANNTYSKIDFKQVKAATDFCIIRVGYRGYGDGTLKEVGGSTTLTVALKEVFHLVFTSLRKQSQRKKPKRKPCSLSKGLEG